MASEGFARVTGFSSIRASFLTAIIERLQKLDRSAPPLLNRVGISPQQLADPYGSVPLAQFVAFLEGASQAIEDTNLGARIGSGLSAGDMGPAGMVLSLSESVDKGLLRFARFTNAVQGGTDASWTSDGDRSVFSYRLTDEAIWPRRQDAEFSLVSLTQVLRDNFNRNLVPAEVHFEHSGTEDDAFLRRFFKCPITYLQPINRMVLSTDDCQRVLRREDRALLSMLERHILDTIGPEALGTSTQEAARRLIEASLGLAPVTLERVAAGLNMSSRKLQRRLFQEGTSVRQLLEECRRAKAKRLLGEPDARVGQTALSLGYADTTAFWRAHRKWTGSNPSARRQRK